MFNNFFKFAFILGFLSSAQAQEKGLNIPLKEADWTVLSYGKIPANKVSFNESSLSVKVSSSAGPIVYKLAKPEKVIGFSVRGNMTGKKVLEAGAFDEDSVLRMGFVATGQKTLSGPKRWFAADWVKKLFALAPEGAGLDKIYFFNLSNRAELAGKSRTHPQSDLILENIFGDPVAEGDFNLTKNFESAIETAAIWISIDGDDSKSDFETKVNSIELRLAN